MGQGLDLELAPIGGQELDTGRQSGARMAPGAGGLWAQLREGFEGRRKPGGFDGSPIILDFEQELTRLPGGPQEHCCG